jgi:O-antigen/teichoic acid export membrane protein
VAAGRATLTTETALKLNPTAAAGRRENPLPNGTLAVGGGLIVAGVTAYAFLSISAHVLDENASAPLAAIWAVMFTVAPGFFMPVEQEVSRAIATRGARGQGAGPLVKRAAALALGLLAILIVACLIAAPTLNEHLFEDQWLLFVALLLGVSGYCAGHLARGLLSGRGRFRPYAIYIGGESTIRLLICIALAVIGVDSAGWYGLAIGIAPAFAVMIILSQALADAHEPGPPAPWNELTPSLGALLAGSVFSMSLMNAAMIAANILKEEGEKAEVKKIFNGVIVARVPLFLFQAVQAAMLPKLSALAGARRFHEFRSSLKSLLQAVSTIGAAGAVGGFVLGPLVVRVAFDVELGHVDVGLLAASTGFFIVALSLAQAMIALEGQGRVAVGWLIGLVSFVVITALGNDLLLRLELASVLSSLVAAVAMASFLVVRLRHVEAEEDRDHATAAS